MKNNKLFFHVPKVKAASLLYIVLPPSSFLSMCISTGSQYGSC